MGRFFPASLTGWGVISMTGLVLLLAGHGIRVTAFLTAGSNFSHIIETVGSGVRSEHKLVTHGIYGYAPRQLSPQLLRCLAWLSMPQAMPRDTPNSYLVHAHCCGTPDSHLRHPAYFGWFWWSIGTQMLLCNPVCIVVYAAASWRFFSQRIPFEEVCRSSVTW